VREKPAYGSRRCAQELCENWSGDGRVCPCALLDLEGAERPIVRALDTIAAGDGDTPPQRWGGPFSHVSDLTDAEAGDV
jgi:hypothetical protein